MYCQVREMGIHKFQDERVWNLGIGVSGNGSYEQAVSKGVEGREREGWVCVEVSREVGREGVRDECMVGRVGGMLEMF